jgi:single-strand DNA-binding protein
MADVNTVSFTGRLTRDPEAIADDKGARFGVAVNRQYRKSGSEDYIEETCFIECRAWNGLGRKIVAKLSKGSFIACQGRLELNEWKQNGEKRQQLRVVVLEATAPDFLKKATPSENEPDQLTEVHDAAGATA